MSNVVKSERKSSSAQFVSTAFELTKITFHRYKKVSKRVADYIFQVIVIPVNRIYEDIMIIRRLYSRENSDLLLRIKLCKKVLGKLEYVASSLDILKRTLDSDGDSCITPHEWSEWIDKINFEMILIEGLMKKEVTEFKKLNFNPLKLFDENEYKKWLFIENLLGIQEFEFDLNDELRRKEDEI